MQLLALEVSNPLPNKPYKSKPIQSIEFAEPPTDLHSSMWDPDNSQRFNSIWILQIDKDTPTKIGKTYHDETPDFLNFQLLGLSQALVSQIETWARPPFPEPFKLLISWSPLFLRKLKKNHHRKTHEAGLDGSSVAEVSWHSLWSVVSNAHRLFFFN